MSNYNSLKATIDANIKQNGNQEITGQILNSVLNQMVTTLGAGYQFAGVATIDTEPGTPDAKVFYIANGKGTYTNFGGLEVTEDEVVVLYWDSSWHKGSTGIASQAKLSELESEVNQLGQKVTKEIHDAFDFKSPQGYYINASGIKTAGSAASVVSGFLEVTEGDVVLFTGGQNEFSSFPVVWGYAGEDESSPVSLLGWGVYASEEITIPSGVNYVRAWSYVSYTNMSLILKGSIIQRINELSITTEGLEEVTSELSLSEPFTINSGLMSDIVNKLDFAIPQLVGMRLSLKILSGSVGWIAYIMKDNDNSTARQVSPINGVSIITYTAEDLTIGRNKVRFYRTSGQDNVSVLLTRYPYFTEQDFVEYDDVTRFLSLDSQKYEIGYPYYSVKSGTASAGSRLDFPIPKIVGIKISLFQLSNSVTNWIVYLMKDNDNSTARMIEPNESGGAYIDYTDSDLAIGRNIARFYVVSGSGAYSVYLSIGTMTADTKASRNYPKNRLTLYDDQKDTTINAFLTDNFSSVGTSMVAASGDNYALYNKRFIGDQRKAQFFITTPSTLSGKVRVGSFNKNTLSDKKYTTCCEIDFSANKMCIYKIADGQNGVASVSTKLVESTLTQTISANTDYIIEVCRNRKITIFRIVNYLTRATDEIYFDGNNVTFVNGAGNHRPYYFVYTNAAGLKFNRLSVMGAFGVSIAHIGDSLSESNGRADGGSTIGVNWIEQLMNENNWDGSIVAQSGMYVADAITALSNEISFMKPRILSVMIGTNSGITSTQINTIKTFCEDNGIILLMHHVPIIGTNPTSSANINATIDAAGVRGARMDVACALNGVVADGIDPSCYNTDEVHTNQVGNNRMAEMARIDCPEMVWYDRDPLVV